MVMYNFSSVAEPSDDDNLVIEIYIKAFREIN